MLRGVALLEVLSLEGPTRLTLRCKTGDDVPADAEEPEPRKSRLLRRPSPREGVTLLSVLARKELNVGAIQLGDSLLRPFSGGVSLRRPSILFAFFAGLLTTGKGGGDSSFSMTFVLLVHAM